MGLVDHGHDRDPDRGFDRSAEDDLFFCTSFYSPRSIHFVNLKFLKILGVHLVVYILNDPYLGGLLTPNFSSPSVTGSFCPIDFH